ncbi:MAG: hypothetical protein INR73_20410 [Williamsia sp.]|nr:hypothetical protein [Williamsia sp.]
MLLKKNIPFKYIFGKIKFELIGVTLYAVAVTLLFEVYHIYSLSIPIAVPTIMITVVSLLLAFRSNQAYDRWWEARTMWGAIVNDSRSWARQISSFIQETIPGDEVYFFKSSMIRRQIAWCVSLNHSLRGKEGVESMDKYLDRGDMHQIKNYNNVPMALLLIQSQNLQLAYRNGWINQFQQIELDNTLTRFSNSMGACERIKKTVFPVTYSMYIHLSLLFFIVLLPFSLLEIFGLMTVPMVVAIAAMYFLIEKMAVHLQDPFENKPTDTPMTSICFTIERDLKQVINDSSLQEMAVKENAYFIL